MLRQVYTAPQGLLELGEADLRALRDGAAHLPTVTSREQP